MWTLSGFADEIDPDLATQCAVLNDLRITHVEFRSAWDTNVLDLTDERFREVRDETENRKRELEHAILGDRGTV